MGLEYNFYRTLVQQSVVKGVLHVEIDGLIGDALCATPAVNALTSMFNNIEVRICENQWRIDKAFTDLFISPKISWTLTQRKDVKYLKFSCSPIFGWSGQPQAGFHEHFEEILLYLLDKTADVKDYYLPIRQGVAFGETEFLVSPFSRSVHENNKNYSDEEWGRFFSAFPDKQFTVVGSLKDEKPWKQDNIKYEYGRSFNDLIETAKKAKLVVTTDNGIGHLMRLAQVTNHIHIVAPFLGGRVANKNALRLVNYEKNDCSNLIEIFKEVC